ncbi:MAG TPA: alpha/beta hydrolase [Steroidobacteraceae bacterium]|nr:alpha/beta hydrolase [Steroidobacteraceae bacterium]
MDARSFAATAALFCLQLTQPYAFAAGTSGAATRVMEAANPSHVRYRSVRVDGLNIFYRETGPAGAPVILLLHGFPASSFMFRDLMAELDGDFRLIAPDYPGFGYSDAPSPQAFAYTFDHLADVVEKFTEALSLQKYGLYMQDFGGPVGFRLASRHPQKVSFLILQNANAYEEGLPESFWALPRELWRAPSAANFQKIRAAAMSDEALEWNYTHGVRNPEWISPDSWILQRALLSEPGRKEIMLALLYDYRSNPPRYAEWQSYFRKHQPPTLITWGKNDAIFPAAGAQAYLRDLPKAELHLLDTGHFALEDHAREIAALIRDFHARAVK